MQLCRAGGPAGRRLMRQESTYALVHSPSPHELSQEVRQRIEHGWWPLGTPFVHGEQYIQAMVQHPTPSETDEGSVDGS